MTLFYPFTLYRFIIFISSLRSVTGLSKHFSFQSLFHYGISCTSHFWTLFSEACVSLSYALRAADWSIGSPLPAVFLDFPDCFLIREKYKVFCCVIIRAILISVLLCLREWLEVMF